MNEILPIFDSNKIKLIKKYPWMWNKNDIPKINKMIENEKIKCGLKSITKEEISSQLNNLSLDDFFIRMNSVSLAHKNIKILEQAIKDLGTSN